MKILSHISLKLIMTAIACGFATSILLQAREVGSNSASTRSGDGARLIVARSANYGTGQHLHLFVDGVQVADLGYGRSYEAVLPPGRHVLSVTPRLAYATQTIVDAKPGRTYAFTAQWINDYQVRLFESRLNK